MSLTEDAARRDAEKLRATQTLVSHMSFCWQHPSVVAIEIAWRWLFGVPFLLVLCAQAQIILSQIPPATTALARLNGQNPWISSVLLVDAAETYSPAVVQALRGIVPLGIVVWAILSGLGRMLVLWRMNAIDVRKSTTLSLKSCLKRLPGMIALQAFWLVVLLGCFWLWYRGISWAAATHITASVEPELVGYLCWLIFFSLGFFILWAILSWTLTIAPVMFFHQSTANPLRALQKSFRLGKVFSSKLVEVNLVMAIVKIALIVLAMVFSAAPLPFSDQFGSDFMHLLYVVIVIVFFIANDYFHVVRLRSFVSFWEHYRDERMISTKDLRLASSTQVDAYSSLLDEFFERIFGEEYEGVWVSDKSSLWDFSTGGTLELQYARINEVYGVDVSDIRGAVLWKILERISTRREQNLSN